jgi:uridine phosphorylase
MPFAAGKTLHMDCTKGDIANRIVTVGTESRAEKIASFFDASPAPKRIKSGRGFLTITGAYNGVPVSVSAIGMGPSMMDFFVRETKAVVDGPIVACRFGTCGGISPGARVGSVVVASGGSSYLTRNPDAFVHRYGTGDKSSGEQYNIHKVCPADDTLSQMVEASLREKLEGKFGTSIVDSGVNVTAESFYSSQGRIHDKFEDGNEGIIDKVCATYEQAKTMEMETFMLFHLARSCTDPFFASAAAIVVANRCNNSTVDSDTLEEVERLGGLAVLDAVSRREI